MDVSSPILSSTNTVKRVIMGITVVPQPDLIASLSKKSKVISSLDTTGTQFMTLLSSQLLTQPQVSSSALKITSTAQEAFMSTPRVSSTIYQLSSTIHCTSSIIDHKSSVPGYSPTMVIYPSSATGYRSSTNYTSSVTDGAITPTSKFMAKSINFTSSVSDSVSSVHVSIINYTSSIIDHDSSIIDHVSSITVPEQSNASITHSVTTKHTSTQSTTDHTSRMSDYMSSISVHHTTVSDKIPIMSTMSHQHTLKPLSTGTKSISSPQAVVSPSRTKVRLICSLLYKPYSLFYFNFCIHD